MVSNIVNSGHTIHTCHQERETNQHFANNGNWAALYDEQMNGGIEQPTELGKEEVLVKVKMVCWNM